MTVANPRSRSWPVPAALLGLVVIRLTAGGFRLIQLSGGPELIAADPRFGAPLPLVLHITAAAVFAIGGAFQMVPAVRRNHLNWHRRAGRVTAGAGLVVATTAIWMTLAFALKPHTTGLLVGLRLAFGTATAASLLLGLNAIAHRRIRAHRAWMLRAYALGLGAGTQVFTIGIGTALAGHAHYANDISSGTAWLLNLAAAEWLIRRRRVPGAAALTAAARGTD